MKKRINKLIYLLVALTMIVASCDWQPIMWDDSKVFVAFSKLSTNIAEDGGNIGIVVAVSALEGAPAVTVDFEFDTVGIVPEKAAFEGENFTLVNASKTLSFPNGWGYDTIWIDPIGNDYFTGDKLCNIQLVSNSLDLQFGAADMHVVTIVDNEHPLAAWLGTFAVDAVSYGDPGNWDEAWTVTTKPDPDDVTILLLSGIGGPDYSSFTDVPGVVDLDAMTITIAGGSEIGTHGRYGGPLAIFFGDESGGIASESDPMIGELSEDGSIHIDHMAIKFVGGINTGYVWDSFDTYFTKTAKKGVKRTVSTDVHKDGLLEQ